MVSSTMTGMFFSLANFEIDIRSTHCNKGLLGISMINAAGFFLSSSSFI